MLSNAEALSTKRTDSSTSLFFPSATLDQITHHAGDDYEKMIQGDPGVEDIYAWGDTMNIPNRGASGSADGVHVMTGPIYGALLGASSSPG